ncbi:GNAT family N-acetyltransferase [Oerskovia sp. NPDC057915]|uniref:GNAT family N-acetyltransferase n=1 Tax=Oerskovia sp. NPDC057915 TaxID=3346280 RepID=UPI0036D7DF71
MTTRAEVTGRARAAGGVTSRIVRVADLGGEDLAAWQRLADSSLEPNLYFEPAVLGAAARGMGGGRAVMAIVVADGSGWLAFLPFETVGRNRLWPARHASLDGPFVERFAALRAPLVDAARPRLAVESLVAALRARRRALGQAVDLPLLRSSGETTTLLLEAFARAGMPVREWDRISRGAFVPGRVPGPASTSAPAPGQGAGQEAGDVLGPQLSASRRKNLRRGRRHLVEELGHELRIVDATDEPDVVEQFLDLEAAGWKGDRAKGGEARRVVPGAAEWFAGLIESYRERGEAHVLRVGPAAEPVYLAVRVRRDGVVFSISDAYDPARSAHSPGAWGRLLGMRLLAEMPGTVLVDSCIDPRRYPDETMLYPDRVDLVSVTCAVGSWPSRVLLSAIVAAGRVRRRVREGRG